MYLLSFPDEVVANIFRFLRIIDVDSIRKLALANSSYLHMVAKLSGSLTYRVIYPMLFSEQPTPTAALNILYSTTKMLCIPIQLLSGNNLKMPRFPNLNCLFVQFPSHLTSLPSIPEPFLVFLSNLSQFSSVRHLILSNFYLNSDTCSALCQALEVLTLEFLWLELHCPLMPAENLYGTLAEAIDNQSCLSHLKLEILKSSQPGTILFLLQKLKSTDRLHLHLTGDSAVVDLIRNLKFRDLIVNRERISVEAVVSQTIHVENGVSLSFPYERLDREAHMLLQTHKFGENVGHINCVLAYDELTLSFTKIIRNSNILHSLEIHFDREYVKSYDTNTNIQRLFNAIENSETIRKFTTDPLQHFASGPIVLKILQKNKSIEELTFSIGCYQCWNVLISDVPSLTRSIRMNSGSRIKTVNYIYDHGRVRFEYLQKKIIFGTECYPKFVCAWFEAVGKWWCEGDVGIDRIGLERSIFGAWTYPYTASVKMISSAFAVGNVGFFDGEFCLNRKQWSD
ncbi:hypothetical protein HK098_003732 [Nowakowskiella sp. JEL0407]|nr:hypothetical protein HK098_003732 [Nowakowskiella sp. JEL0407]